MTHRGVARYDKVCEDHELQNVDGILAKKNSPTRASPEKVTERKGGGGDGLCNISLSSAPSAIFFKVAAKRYLKLEIRLHASPVGTNTQSGT